LTVLNGHMRLIMDHHKAEDMMAKNNLVLNFDGIVRRHQLPSFVVQYSLVKYMLGLGLHMTGVNVGTPQMPNDFHSFQNVDTEVSHPIMLYFRSMDRIYNLLGFSKEETGDFIQRYRKRRPQQ
jgi:pre-mRNA-processing factor 8